MKLDFEYIEKIAKLLNDNGLSEVSLKDGEQAVTVKKNNVTAQSFQTVDKHSNVTNVEQSEQHKGQAITAPMVGTLYLSPAKGSEPFVSVGKKINSGDTVCIIEAMKLMNEIDSEYSGTITEICVENGQPVEYGQILMYIE